MRFKWWDNLTDEELEEKTYPLKVGALILMILFFTYLVFSLIKP